jgi:error-prone DNA polymerase
VAHVGDDLAEAILWERRHAGGATEQHERPFASLTDFCTRLRPAGLTWQAAEALLLAGAFDGLKPTAERRRRLWQLHEVWPLVAPTRLRRSHSGRGRRGGRRREPAAEQLALEWCTGSEVPNEAPPLPALTADERQALDYQFLGMSAQPHPLRLLRRQLRRSGIRTIAEVGQAAEGRVVRVAGWAISAQRPPTARGMGFVVLEDETGRLPIAMPPRLAAELHRRLRDAREIVITGRVERVRWYRSLLAYDLRTLRTIAGPHALAHTHTHTHTH